MEEVKSFSCVWLCDPMDCNLPGSCVDGIFQAKILEGVAISFSKSAMKGKCKSKWLFKCQLFT